ncbi:hypothetical protein GCM10007160_00310 [Litchfieldella qijiaojingensis]|uniref:Pyrrolo-quinoline quinone repeat domain-containing protein n=1 Tax=Litchfieldella qijiaojingensis TaxID=980347 RepID=A0ABQ2YA87_9GAMM|nr:PQQ-binding-like beta-propeller repeat protein [Halomonas qijiaojingensis]GGX77085.1 hypothetical protein GCM10007160_00310 [Halomonas qijiaojingensis]
MFKFAVALVCGVLMVVGSSAVSGGTLYPSNPLLSEHAVFVSHEGIARIDRRTGETVWTALTGEQTFEPVIAAGWLLAGTSSGLVALSPESGEVIWRRFTDEVVFSPSVADNLAFIAGRDGRLRALDLPSGEVRWTRQFDGWVYPPAVQDGVLITGGQDARLWALEPVTGTSVWEIALQQELVYRPIAGKTLVYVTTFAGELLALNPTDGSIRWRFHDDRVSTSPAVDDRFIYLGRFDGVLQVLDQTTGELRYRQQLGQGPLRPPHVGDGRIAVADRERLVTVLDTESFEIAWQARLLTPPLASPWFEHEEVAIAGPGYRRYTFALSQDPGIR